MTEDGGPPEGAAPGPGEERPPLSLPKRVLFSLVLLSVSMGIALVVAEIAVRLVAPQQLIVYRPDIWASVDSLGWRNAENLDTEINTGERAVRLVTDSEGFRVGPEGRRVESDSLLLIGDSFMAALQVEHEQSLAGLIEDSIRGPAGQEVAVRNSGVGSWDPWHYLIFGRRRLASHRYGLALVSVFVGNDVVQQRRDYIPPSQAEERPTFRIPFSLSPRAWIDGVARPMNNALETRSHLYVFLKNRTQPLRIRLGLAANYVPRGLLRENADGPEWAVTADILADLDAAAREAGVPMLFALVPAQYQVEEDLFAAHAQAFGVDTSAVDLDQPNRLLGAELTERGLDVIDALPAFREAARSGEKLFGTVDPHLSPEGHLVLFELLEEPIRERLGWADPASR